MHQWSSTSTFSHRLFRRLSHDRGQALVEFAVVLPVLILVILGILYFGRYENYANQETQMAEQGARWASVNVNPSTTLTLQNYIKAQASGELLNGSTDVTSPVAVYIYYPTGSGGNVIGNQVRVCVTAGVALPFLGTSETITETANMRIEQLATSAVWTANTSWPSTCPSS